MASIFSRIPVADLLANTAVGALLASGAACAASGVSNLFKNPEPFDDKAPSFHGTKDIYWKNGEIPKPGEEFLAVKPLFFTKSRKEAAYYALNTDEPFPAEPVCLTVRPVKECQSCVKTNLFGKKFFVEQTPVRVEQVIQGKEAIEKFLKAPHTH